MPKLIFADGPVWAAVLFSTSVVLVIVATAIVEDLAMRGPAGSGIARPIDGISGRRMVEPTIAIVSATTANVKLKPAA
jgi:hypothetical protein